MWNNLKTWRTKRFTVSLDWAWEDYPDLSWDDTGEVTAKLNSGEWGNYTFRVRVLCDGREISADYLGNSIYASPEDFYREHIGIRAQGPGVGCYFTDMIATAIGEARKALCDPPRVRCV